MLLACAELKQGLIIITGVLQLVYSVISHVLIDHRSSQQFKNSLHS